VGGAFSHPAATATRTEASFTRESDQPVEAAVATAKPREPAGEPATLQKVPELLLDEPRQPFPVAQAGRLRAKGLEVIVHDLVERTLRGRPRFVARRGRGHSRPAGGRGASEEGDDIGLNPQARERPVADIAAPCVSRDRGSCTTWNDAVLHIPGRMCETCSWRNHRRKERPRPKKNRLHPIANCRSSMRHA
jgi:hypothetical protein